MNENALMPKQRTWGEAAKNALVTGADYAGRGLALADLYSGGMLTSVAGLNPFGSYNALMEARDRALEGVPRDFKAAASEPINPLVAMAAIPAAAAKKGIRAYHGSPHDFDKFDMSKIGTGEGAQAYGHGLYFAESEGVARSYRDTLAGAHNALWDSRKNERSVIIENPVGGDEWRAAYASMDPVRPGTLGEKTIKFDNERFSTFEDALAHARKQGYIKTENPAFTRYDYDLERHVPLTADEIRALGQDEAQILVRDPGRMYEVNIKADPEDFLDWDKPLSQQSEKVRGALARVDIKPEMTGAHKTGDEIYALAGNPVPDGPDAVRQLAVSERLRDAGISGIKYLDAGSRGAGDGSRNYVLFRDDIIEVVRKYGMAAAASMYGMDAVMSAMNEQPDG